MLTNKRATVAIRTRSSFFGIHLKQQVLVLYSSRPNTLRGQRRSCCQLWRTRRQGGGVTEQVRNAQSILTTGRKNGVRGCPEASPVSGQPAGSDSKQDGGGRKATDKEHSCLTRFQTCEKIKDIDSKDMVCCVAKISNPRAKDIRTTCVGNGCKPTSGAN